MQHLLKLDGRTSSGGSPLLMHNERLADPLNEWTRKIAAISKKRGKTEADHLEIARLEFLGSMYANGNGPCIPAWNVLRCLQEGATRHKRGKDVLRGVYPLTEHADLLYDGPRDLDELWQDGSFSYRASVGVQRARTMRTRPVFIDWKLEVPIEVDPIVFDLDSLQGFFAESGRYVGLGDRRPVNGRFVGTITEAAAAPAAAKTAKR